MIGRCRASPARSSSATSRLGGREGPVHAADEIADELRRHRELPVGEELDQHRRQQRVVRRLEPRHRRRAEPAREVGQRAAASAPAARGRSPSGCRRPPRDGCRGGRAPPRPRRSPRQPVDVLDRERRVAGQRGEIEAAAAIAAGCRAPLRAAQTCARWVLPAPCGPGHRQPPRRPGRPAVDLRQRQRVRRRDEEVRPPERRPRRQVEHELPRARSRRPPSSGGTCPV